MKPILYSFRRCPYAIRARMILDLCSIDFCLREVALSNKPKDMLKASPKGTVPILILPQKKVLDESMDIVFWAIKKTSKTDKKFLEWLDEDLYGRSMQLIEENDNKLKYGWTNINTVVIKSWQLNIVKRQRVFYTD